ncbi:MAG: hypothetical protein IKD06_04955 [Clostridia bacterium]|nr:hypothetical protein [Clostridia bacterium]
MTNRERFVSYVKYGSGKPFCSPQIGAGAGFDTRLAGKEWFSQTTVEDTVAACKRFNIVPLYNFGLDPVIAVAEDGFGWRNVSLTETADRRIVENEFFTPDPALKLTMRTIEDRLKGGFSTKTPLEEEGDLDAFELYVEALLGSTHYHRITEHVAHIRSIIGEDEALSIQWEAHPLGMLGLITTMNMVLFPYDYTERVEALYPKILQINDKILDAVKAGGADFIFLGGPGPEISSPDLYKRYFIPHGAEVADNARSKGLLVYSHVCSPVEPFLTYGFYNDMKPDLFETLSQAPVGNIVSLEDALGKIPAHICTRGNVGLDELLYKTPEEIYQRSTEILKTAAKLGRKHILAASDYLFYGISEENVEAMARAAEDFAG